MNFTKAAGLLGQVCFLGGFASIIGSIAIWYIKGGSDLPPEAKAHGERFGIFVGLWAPTFFILSHRLSHFARELSDNKS
ncbi:MAG: hypothetical protein EBT92_10895 [Planctomycetes bacterium]|nr:hypothetical protein [Planctomycetota bacterium]NBY03298.1 hypothetical protein [Planctomycetota bacterium]